MLTGRMHAVQLVKFEVFKSKIHGLHSCVALLRLKSLISKRQPIKMLLRNSGFAASEAKQNMQKTDRGHLHAAGSYFIVALCPTTVVYQYFSCLCRVLASKSKSTFVLAGRMALDPPKLAQSPIQYKHFGASLFSICVRACVRVYYHALTQYGIVCMYTWNNILWMGQVVQACECQMTCFSTTWLRILSLFRNPSWNVWVTNQPRITSVCRDYGLL